MKKPNYFFVEAGTQKSIQIKVAFILKFSHKKSFVIILKFVLFSVRLFLENLPFFAKIYEEFSFYSKTKQKRRYPAFEEKQNSPSLPSLSSVLIFPFIFLLFLCSRKIEKPIESKKCVFFFLLFAKKLFFTWAEKYISCDDHVGNSSKY